MKNGWLTNCRWAPLCYIIIVILWMVSVGLSVYSPESTQSSLQISAANRTLLQISIVVPLLAIWLTAMSGAVAFKQYAQVLPNDSAEKPAIRRIANGLMFLVAYIVLISILGSLPSYLAGRPEVNLAVMAKNYLPMLAALAGFGLIFSGTQQLRRVIPFSIRTRLTYALLAGLGVVSVIFTVAFFATFQSVNTLRPGVPVYATPPALLFFLLILPYISIWFLGLLACLNLNRYAQKVRGSIYRQSLKELKWGIIGVISFITFFQVLILLSPVLTSLGFASVLLILYALLVSYGTGFWIIARASRRLAHIEVVP
jgi:hypothetical protein